MFRLLAKTTLFTAIVIGGVAFLSGNTLACAVCLSYPEKTAADHLLAADCVILARQAPGDPFTYAPVECLRGVWKGDDIDLLVNSQTRRRLQSEPARKVVLLRDSQGEWLSLGIASPEFEALTRRILLFAEKWKGEQGQRKRWEFFLPMFGHQDAAIGRLAYLELGRAPYDVVRKLGRMASREDFMPLLTSPRFLEWRSLAILLLAQSDAPGDQRYVIEAFRNASRFGPQSSLSAWAAAAIEVDGVKAIDDIEQRYFRRKDRTPEEIDAVAKALSLHGAQGASAVRDRVVASYAALLACSDEHMQLVADDLYTWKRTELTGLLSQILQQNASLKPADRKSILRYLGAASAAGERTLAID